MTNEELIKALRLCGSPDTVCKGQCPYYGVENCLSKKDLDAADALESAEKRIAELEAQLSSAQPERKYTLEEVAEILASVIGEECACNINGIDEWLPESCKYTEIGEECPNPKEKHGCWMQFLLNGGAQI